MVPEAGLVDPGEGINPVGALGVVDPIPAGDAVNAPSGQSCSGASRHARGGQSAPGHGWSPVSPSGSPVALLHRMQVGVPSGVGVDTGVTDDGQQELISEVVLVKRGGVYSFDALIVVGEPELPAQLVCYSFLAGFKCDRIGPSLLFWRIRTRSWPSTLVYQPWSSRSGRQRWPWSYSSVISRSKGEYMGNSSGMLSPPKAEATLTDGLIEYIIGAKSSILWKE